MLLHLLYEALKLEPRDSLLWLQCADALEEQSLYNWARVFRGRANALKCYDAQCLNSLYPISPLPDSPYIWVLVNTTGITNECLTTLIMTGDPGIASNMKDVQMEIERLGLDKIIAVI